MPKLAPKNVKICPGCPPKEIKPVVTPNFRMSEPVLKNQKKIVTLVDRSSYKHGISKKGKSESLF